MAAFGYSVGDFIAVVQLAYKVSSTYMPYKESTT
jgi:hypothetical protein